MSDSRVTRSAWIDCSLVGSPARCPDGPEGYKQGDRFVLVAGSRTAYVANRFVCQEIRNYCWERRLKSCG